MFHALDVFHVIILLIDGVFHHFNNYIVKTVLVILVTYDYYLIIYYKGLLGRLPPLIILLDEKFYRYS